MSNYATHLRRNMCMVIWGQGHITASAGMVENMRSSGILRGVVWYFFTDVSGQGIGLIFKDQESVSSRTLDPWRWDRNVGKELPHGAA